MLQTPLYWLEIDQPDFFKKDVRHLLKRYDLWVAMNILNKRSCFDSSSFGSGSHEHDGSLKVVPMEKETKTGLVQLVIHALDTDALLSPAVFSSGSLPFETRMWQK